MDSFSAWHGWLIVAAACVALEIKLAGSFVTLWFGVGALGAALAAALGLGLGPQLGLFSAVSLALFAASRTVFQRFFVSNTPELKVGAEAMVGAEALVTEALPERGTGTVRVNGELWTARSVEGAVAAGETVRIEHVDGLRLHVRRTLDIPLALAADKENR